jgi:tRNA pseudouridine55 synthase
MRFVLFEKKLCETPLEALKRLRLERPELAEQKLAYAGRLDPQATGQLLVLIGDECKRRDHYQKLAKIYTFDMLVGASTDTGDVMGLPTLAATSTLVSQAELQPLLTGFVGKQTQASPAFSAQRVNGKSLWQHARLESADVTLIAPLREIEIYQLELLSSGNLSAKELLQDIETRVSATHGNFRQAEIIAAWQKLLEKSPAQQFQYFTMRAKVSSGTYIRQLAMDIGEKLGEPTLCWHIHRDEVLLT